MKTRVLTRSLALLFIARVVGLCDEMPEKPKDHFPKWAFCVAYQVRDPDERDARPVDPSPDAVKDPLNDGDTWIPYGLINDRNVVDVAALTTRLVKSGSLKHQAAEGVIRATTAGTERHPIMECYEPHHLFVFYGYEGHPVAAIEVCFSCNRVKMTPEVRVREGTFGPFETADLAGLAKIATDAGLDLKPFASLDEYVQRLDRLTKRITEEAEKDGTGQPTSGKDGDKACELHHHPLKRVTGFFPDPAVTVSPEYGGTEFRVQFGHLYPHVRPWTFSPARKESWNLEVSVEVCGECESAYEKVFAAYLKIDEKVRRDQYMEFLKNHPSPAPQGDGTNKDAAPAGTLDHLPSDIPPP